MKILPMFHFNSALPWNRDNFPNDVVVINDLIVLRNS